MGDLSKKEVEELKDGRFSETPDFSAAFRTEIFQDGIVREVSEKDLLRYLNNPQENNEALGKVSEYYYNSNGEIFQLYDLTRILASLKYTLTSFKKGKKSDDIEAICSKHLRRVNHKQLTRDIISQEISKGTITGIWVGTENPYLIIFDDLDYFFPGFRTNGEWTVIVDLSYYDKFLEDDVRKQQIGLLSPYIKYKDYKKYKNDTSNVLKRYKVLPQERTICLRTHALKRNQKYGLPWATQAMFDILHKKKLKDLEKVVANKIIKSIAILTLGNKEFNDAELGTKKKKKAYNGVKTALKKNNEEGVSVVALPHWAKLEFPELKSEALNPNKFDKIDQDISSSTGINRQLLVGGGNESGNEMSLVLLYRKIGELLEQIEFEVYQKLINLVVPKDEKDNIILEYDKDVPLSNKEKLEGALKLADKGFSIKEVASRISNQSFDEFIAQTMYETEVLDLQNKVKPYQTSHTLSSVAAAKTDETDGATNTDNNKETDTNEA